MELQRYEMGDYCSGYVPNDDGDVCMSYDVQRLEESHKELLNALKTFIEYNDQGGPMSFDTDAMWAAARNAITNAEGKK